MTPPLPIRATVKASYARYFAAPWTFLLLAVAAPAGFGLAIVGIVDSAGPILDAGLNLPAILAAALALAFVLLILCMGALVSGADRIGRGEALAVTTAMAASKRRLPAMLATALPILALGLSFLFAARPYADVAWLLVPLVLAVANVTVFALAIPICLIERLNPLASFERSIRLTRGSRVRLFAAFFLVLLPITFSTAFLRALSPFGAAINLVSATLQFAALSIQSVVAFEMLAPGGPPRAPTEAGAPPLEAGADLG